MIDQRLILEALKNKFTLEIRDTYICQAGWGPPPALSRIKPEQRCMGDLPHMFSNREGKDERCPPASLELH